MRDFCSSSFPRTVCERKFVSMSTRYGGPSASFCRRSDSYALAIQWARTAWKNMEEGACGISLLAFSASAFFLASSSPDIWFFALQGGQPEEGKRLDCGHGRGRDVRARHARGNGGAHTVGHLAGLRTLDVDRDWGTRNAPITRFICANLRVFFATPMAAECVDVSWSQLRRLSINFLDAQKFRQEFGRHPCYFETRPSHAAHSGRWQHKKPRSAPRPRAFTAQPGILHASCHAVAIAHWAHLSRCKQSHSSIAASPRHPGHCSSFANPLVPI